MALRDFKLKRPDLLFFLIGGFMNKYIEWAGVIILGVILGLMFGWGF
jgi:hypothetical protein